MASNIVKSNRMKRMESKKSHSWWWDSHISPKNNKWLQENLEEMDHHIKRMLKLIEEDADSFAKKAELYFKKRPELVSLVEEFYRMYRSLAERYDHVTGELRKNIPSDLQSQGSGISDASSEPPSAMASPDQKPERRKSGPRAAGFDYFLGSNGGGADLNSSKGDDSSTLDSESESDDSSVNNYSGSQSNDEEQALRKKIIDLEAELRVVKEKSEDLEKPNFETTEVSSKIATYEEELRVAKAEIVRLTIELEKYKSLGDSDHLILQESVSGPEAEISDSAQKFREIEEELRNTQKKLHDSEEEVTSLKQELMSKSSSIQNLQDQLKSAQREVSIAKTKLEKEKREVSKLHDRITRYKTNLSERDQEIRVLKETISNANKSLSEENERLQAEVTRMTKERAYLEDNIKELDLTRQSLEEDVRRAKAGKEEMEILLGTQIEQLKVEIFERENLVEEVNKRAEALNAKIAELESEMNSKDHQIGEMSKHLHELHMQHVELISDAEGARKLAEELRLRVKELDTEVERKQEIILQGAEEKREAIRQLCFSLEHYRDGYHRLRQAVIGHKRQVIMAS